MDVHLKNPELQAKVNHWVAETGRSADELVEDAMAGYFDELRQVREMLDSRYDDIKSVGCSPSTVKKPLPGCGKRARPAAKAARERLHPASPGVRRPR